MGTSAVVGFPSLRARQLFQMFTRVVVQKTIVQGQSA
jgi:hypothetical protein